MSVWLRWRGRRGAAARDRTGSHPFDRATGMDTAGLSGSYYATAPSLFTALIERWGGDAAAYCFIDLGCGKGRVVLLASQLGFRECIGVELDPSLAAIAEANAARWRRGVCPMRFVRGDATEFDFPDGRCLVYLFNPFPREVLERMLERIAAAFAERPGELDLLYVNAEFSGLFEAYAGFELLWKMPVTMSDEDADADLLYLAGDAGQGAYGEDGCSAWRWVGR